MSAPSALYDAYVSGGARAFFGAHYADADDRRAAVARAVRPLRAEVAAALAAQNARLAPSAARDAHLAALGAGAAAVVSGQQVGLFLGPLFTIYKAASAVRVAQALAAESGRPVVPVFWLQSEDHDLAEIAQYHLPRAHETLTLRLPAADNRVAVAHLVLPAEISACLASLEAEIGPLPHGAAHLERLARHYRPGAGWVAAFAGVLGELFAEAGLVLVDPRDPALAAAAAGIHRRALVDAEAIAAALVARTEQLSAAGFAAAVHVRPGAPLGFYHPDGAGAPRYRLAPAGDGGFAEVRGSRRYQRPALLAALDRDPSCFSTSVLLRPIAQDTLLPTAAYVGGPGEIAYFAQLAPLYAAYDLAMPLVVPRARFRLVDAATARCLGRLGLAAAEAECSEADLLARHRARHPGAYVDAAGLARTLLDPFDAALSAAAPRIEAVDPTLRAAIDKTRASVEGAASKLAEKTSRASQRRDQLVCDASRRVVTHLHPNGMPQERVCGLAPFAARYGDRAVVERVLAAVAPFDPTPRDLAWADGSGA